MRFEEMRHPSRSRSGSLQIIYKIPWGVDSDQFWGQTEVANPLNLAATNATQSPLRRTARYANKSGRNFRLIGTQLFNLADHVAVAWRRREDVEAQRLGWGHRCAAVALFGTQAEGVRADGAILPDHRHSRGGTGWLLDSSGAAERGNRELRCRCCVPVRRHAPGSGPRPTGSTARLWCARYWRTNAANRVSAPWSGRRRLKTKTAAVFAVSARR